MKRIILTQLVIVLFTFTSIAQVINANSDNYTSLLSTLTPGDTLLLAPGSYTDRLNIFDMNGTDSQPIVIMGSGNSTIFLGEVCCNTVSIKTSSFITLRGFKIDGQNLAIDGVKAEGTAGNWAHHIILENLLIIGHGANQQIVGISTKCPAWDWVIKGCTIDAAGTGIYLGHSNGEAPFVNGIIEYNLIKNTLGYNLQIKHQNVGSRNVPGMTLNGKTVVRHNVFSKESNASLEGDARPNLLVGNFPLSGDGANDQYEIYGNFLWQNPSESLFQGTGNIAFYDNICVNNSGGNGITFQVHNSFEPRDIKIFHNTIINDLNWGIRLMDTDLAYQKYIYGNAVFSDHTTPIRVVGGGVSTANLSDNVVDVVSSANNYVNNASNNIATIDLYPKTGSALNATLIPNSLFVTSTDYSMDFNVNTRNWNYRGAYTGEGTNDGWQLAIEKKPVPDPITTSIQTIPENHKTTEAQLYPNPARERVYLYFDKPIADIELSMITLSGKEIFKQNFKNYQKIELSTINLSGGVYLIKVRSKDFSTVLKMIKK